MNVFRSSGKKAVFAVVLLAVIGALIVPVCLKRTPDASDTRSAPTPQPLQPVLPALYSSGIDTFSEMTDTNMASGSSNTGRRRPLPAHLETASYVWTAEDAREPAVLKRLARNELEYDRLISENRTIFRRQLVYQKQPFSLKAQATRVGEPLTELTLPGLDGREFLCQVTGAEIEAGGDRGSMVGKLQDRPDSMITVSFLGAREAFTIVSPEDGLFLHGMPRDSGELFVLSVNPETYGGRLGDGDAILTSE